VNGLADLWQLMAALVLLLMRGDVARWCTRVTSAPADAKPARAAMLHPWIGMVAVVLLLQSLPALPGVAATALGWFAEPAPFVPSSGFAYLLSHPVLLSVAALTLLLATRQLSSLLSYGSALRVLGRWWSAMA